MRGGCGELRRSETVYCVTLLDLMYVLTMNRFLATSVLAGTLTFTASAMQPKADFSPIEADDKLLNGLEIVFQSTPPFGKEFTRASIKLADERGPEIIHAIMARSHKWHDEEGLVYVVLIDMLPREPALKILRQYQHSKQESQWIWAGDFITEFGISGKDPAAIRREATEK